MKLKKLIGLLISVSVIATSLVGCGSSPKEEAEGSDGNTVNLIWYVVNEPQKDTEKVIEKVNEYTKEKINTTVTFKEIGFGDYDQKMQVITNSGDEYDLAFTCEWANNYLVNARKGSFLKLDDLLDKYGKDMKSSIDESFWKGATVDGGIYGVPTSKELGVQSSWVFNKELVDKYNVPYQDLHTLQDLEPYLKMIKENEPEITPLFLTTDGIAIRGIDTLLKPLGVANDSTDLKVESFYETEKAKEDIATARDYYLKGYINQDAMNVVAGDNSPNFFVRQAGGNPLSDADWKKSFGIDVVSSAIEPAVVNNMSTQGAMTAISSNSKHPEEAMKFLNLLNTDEYLRNLLNNGIEGDHYTKNDDGTIKLTDNASNYRMSQFVLGNMFILDVNESEPKDKWKQLKAFNDSLEESPTLGFQFDTTSVSTQIAAVKNVEQEFHGPLLTGSVDPEEYLKKLDEKLKDAGIDDIKEEMQKQLDEWKKLSK